MIGKLMQKKVKVKFQIKTNLIMKELSNRMISLAKRKASILKKDLKNLKQDMKNL